MRVLVAVCLCLAFQGVQEHVLRTNRDSVTQTAAHQTDGTPDHDWRRAGDGTTRTLQAHVSLERLVIPMFRLDLLETDRTGPVALRHAGTRLTATGGPPTPLRV